MLTCNRQVMLAHQQAEHLLKYLRCVIRVCCCKCLGAYYLTIRRKTNFVAIMSRNFKTWCEYHHYLHGIVTAFLVKFHVENVKCYHDFAIGWRPYMSQTLLVVTGVVTRIVWRIDITGFQDEFFGTTISAFLPCMINWQTLHCYHKLALWFVCVL